MKFYKRVRFAPIVGMMAVSMAWGGTTANAQSAQPNGPSTDLVVYNVCSTADVTSAAATRSERTTNWTPRVSHGSSGKKAVGWNSPGRRPYPWCNTRVYHAASQAESDGRTEPPSATRATPWTSRHTAKAATGKYHDRRPTVIPPSLADEPP